MIAVGSNILIAMAPRHVRARPTRLSSFPPLTRNSVPVLLAPVLAWMERQSM
jgi:hypothetical protein